MISNQTLLKSAAITILIDRDYTQIELYDNTSGQTFAVITLTPEQLSSALSRLGDTPCKIEVGGLDKLNKKMLVESLEFEVPEGWSEYHDKEQLIELADATCPEGWISDGYFNRQDSFFYKDNKRYARVTIRKWVEEASLDTTP